MFEYFPQNYAWSSAVLSALNRGGVIGEVDDACRSLREASVRDDQQAQVEWCESWKKVAERVEGLARVHEEAGQFLSAGRKCIRAGIYYIIGEEMLNHRDPKKEKVYKHGLAAFKKGIQFRKEPVEWIDVPYQGKFLPALFTKAPVKEPGPCIVHFDGFDAMKELIYQSVAEEYRRRGISLLIVDHPGVGEALHLRNIHGGPDTEVPAAACVDYLETRSDVDAQRVGIAALSLGGYYAPRAAAFEKRFKCCVAWNGYWDYGVELAKRLAREKARLEKEKASVPRFSDRLMWVFGKEKIEEAAAVGKQLTLEGVADKITCPLLIVHGENDRQTPLWHAEKLFAAAVNSPNRKLKVFTSAEGGVEHCQKDNQTLATDYMTDWVAGILGGNPKGIY